MSKKVDGKYAVGAHELKYRIISLCVTFQEKYSPVASATFNTTQVPTC